MKKAVIDLAECVSILPRQAEELLAKPLDRKFLNLIIMITKINKQVNSQIDKDILDQEIKKINAKDYQAPNGATWSIGKPE